MKEIMDKYGFKGFSMKHANICDHEQKCVLLTCARYNLPYKFCRRPEESPQDYIPVGNVLWCEHFLDKTITIPDYYPEFLSSFLKREIWLSERWPLGKKVFIKPADRHKRFTGFITSGTYRKKKRGPFWCSEIVQFKNE